MRNAKANLYPTLALGTGLLFLGFAAIFVRWANAPGIMISFYRMSIAALVLAVPALRNLRKKAGISARGILFAALGGIFFAGDLALWSEGILHSGATTPTLMANMAPVWVGLATLVIFKKRLPAVFWAGLGLAFIGGIIILGLDIRALTFDLGSGLGLLAGLLYAAFMIVSQYGRKHLDALSYLWISVFSGSLLMLAVGLFSGTPFTGYAPQTYWSFLGLGVLIQSGGWWAINYAQGYLPATLVSATLLGQPVITALLAAPLLNEFLTPWQVVGGSAAVLGVLLVHRSKKEQA